MLFPSRTTVLALAVAAALPAVAQTTPPTLPVVTVTANGIPSSDADATYASEVHERSTMAASGAITLYDYLAQYTSLNVMPSYGNKVTPMLDLRGYGTENGYQNVVVTVDGQRMNNIDQVGPTIGMLPLDSIERIEISKGSGSVRFGDGAMGGAINITTRARTGVAVSAMAGNYGAQGASVAAGLSKELFDMSASASNNRFGGTGDADPTGHHDSTETRSEQARLTVRPLSGLSVFAQGANLYADVRYPNPMSLAQYNSNPAQYVAPSSGSNQYQHQKLESRTWRLGAEYQLNDSISFAYTWGGEDRDSRFVSWGYAYDSSNDELSVKYRGAATDVIMGVQSFKGTRIDTNNQTSKDNLGIFIQGQHRIDMLTLSAGVRDEEVDYLYAPSSGRSDSSSYSLQAWDVGANYRLDAAASVFANYNHGFQAPDIDRFFKYGGGFNGFITPAKVNNFTLGFNHDTPRNKLRTAVFYSRLQNEIYYDSISYTNTNLDKTHKYGLEASDTWLVRDDLQLRATYTYTQAIIDQTSQGNGSYNGKDLPGVPAHAVTLGLSWQPWAGGTLNASHVWRDSSYATSDFANSRTQRQAAYQTTNLSLRQRWGKVEGFVAVDNLFDESNAIWGSEDNAIYPVDYRRLVRVGVKAEM